MAANDFSATSPIYREELRAFGHDLHIDFSLSNPLLIPEDWTLYNNLTATCNTTPTSWMIRITLDKAPNILVVSGTAKIKRTDTIKHSVGTLFEVTIYHPLFGFHITTPEVDKVFNRGDEMFVNIPNIVPSKHKDLLSEKLSLNFRFSVINCHRPFSSLLPPSPKKVSPKKPSPKKPSPKKPPEEENRDVVLGKRWHHTEK